MTQISLTGAGKSKGQATWWMAAGYTGAIAAWLGKGSASLAASYINLVTPGTFNLALGVAPTWAANSGWLFGGTQWLNTGITPNSNTFCALVQVSAGTNGGLIGSTGAGGGFGIRLSPANSIWYYADAQWNSGAAALPQNRALIGLGTGAGQPYMNGVASGAVQGAGTANSGPWYLGTMNFGGNPLVVPSVSTIVAAMVGSTMPTPAQVAAIAAAMALL